MLYWKRVVCTRRGARNDGILAHASLAEDAADRLIDFKLGRQIAARRDGDAGHWHWHARRVRDHGSRLRMRGLSYSIRYSMFRRLRGGSES